MLVVLPLAVLSATRLAATEPVALTTQRCGQQGIRRSRLGRGAHVDQREAAQDVRRLDVACARGDKRLAGGQADLIALPEQHQRSGGSQRNGGFKRRRRIPARRGFPGLRVVESHHHQASRVAFELAHEAPSAPGRGAPVDVTRIVAGRNSRSFQIRLAGCGWSIAGHSSGPDRGQRGVHHWPRAHTLASQRARPGPVTGFQENMLAFFENLQRKFPEYLSMVKGSIVSVAEAAGKIYKLTAQTTNGDMVFFTKAIIIATGATRKNLPVPGAKELQGKGSPSAGPAMLRSSKTTGLRSLAAAIRPWRISLRSPSTPKK